MPRNARKVPWLDWRDGVAYACWYDAEALRTRRKSLGARDAVEAQKRFAAFLAEGHEIYAVTQGRKFLLVRDALEYYYQEHRKNTINGTDFPTSTQAHLNRHLGEMPIKDVDVPTCREYARVRAQEGAAANSIKGEIGAIATAARHCQKFKHLRADELPQIEIPEGDPGRDRWLTHQELAKLRLAGSQGFTDFVDLCYWTASRKEAIHQLTKFQVDLAQQRIKLAKPGEKRTKKRRPIVPIAPDLLPTVQRLMVETPGEFLLPKRSYDWDFKQATKKLGFSDVSPHTLRHTRISHLLQAGVHPWTVAGLAGLTLQTLTAVYAHHCPAHLREALTQVYALDAG